MTTTLTLVLLLRLSLSLAGTIPPLDSFTPSVDFTKTVHGRSSSECGDTIYPDTVIGFNYEVALVLPSTGQNTCFYDGRYCDADFPVEFGKLTSTNTDGLEFNYYKVGEPVIKATQFVYGHLKVYFKPMSGAVAYNVWRYSNGNFRNIAHISKAEVETAIGNSNLNGVFALVPPTSSVSSSVAEEKVLPGKISQACRTVDGVKIHTDAVIDAEDVLAHLALVKLPQNYQKGDAGKSCYGQPYQDAMYPARKVTLTINAPHITTTIDAYEVDRPQEPATQFVASKHAIYFQPLDGIQAYRIWTFDDVTGYFEALEEVPESEVSGSAGFNEGPWPFYNDISTEFKEDEIKTLPGDSKSCNGGTYDDANVNVADTIGSIALVLLPQYPTGPNPNSWTGSCWTGNYMDSNYPTSFGEIVVTNNIGEKLNYTAYKVASPTPASAFRASAHGLYVKLDNNVPHIVWAYIGGEFKALKEISQAQIDASAGKNDGYVYTDLKAHEIKDAPFFILPSSDPSVFDDIVDSLGFPEITTSFVQTTVTTSSIYGKTIFVLPSLFDLNGALYENFQSVDAGYIHANIDVQDIGNDPFIIEAAETRVSVRSLNGQTGIESTMVMNTLFRIVEHRFPIDDSLTPFDPNIRWTYGLEAHHHKYSTRKRLIHVSRSDGKSGVVFQDEESNDIHVTWFDGLLGTETLLLHSGVDHKGYGFMMYGATSDGDSVIYIFIVSLFSADKDSLGVVNENYCQAKLIKCNAFNGNIVLTKDVNTLESALNIRTAFSAAGSLKYLPAAGGKGPILGLLTSKGRWDGHQACKATVWNADTLELVKDFGTTSSHSFANWLGISNNSGKFIAVDLGDNYPRGINLHEFDDANKNSEVVYQFKTHHSTNDQGYPIFEQISTPEKTYYKQSNDNNVYTEISSLVEHDSGYLVFFTGERRPLDNTQVGANLNNPRQLGLIRTTLNVFSSIDVSQDIIRIANDGSSDLETGYFYNFNGGLENQSNIGILWLTSFGGGVEGSKDISESASRVKAIHVKEDLNVVLYEVWSATEYIRTMIMAVDNVGVVVQPAMDIGYALRLAPADELYLSDEGVIIGYSGTQSSYEGDSSFLTRFEICYDFEISNEPSLSFAPSKLNEHSLSFAPTTSPSNSPSIAPSTSISAPTTFPTYAPSTAPTYATTTFPTNAPTSTPTNAPSSSPTVSSYVPTNSPSIAPFFLTSAPTKATRCTGKKYPECSQLEPLCVWENNTCVEPTCEGRRWKNCKTMKPACVWSKKTCVEPKCGGRRHKNCIKMDPVCMWDKYTKWCYDEGDVPSCDKATTKWRCNKVKEINSICYWDFNAETCQEIAAAE